ncbi:hypothetical protein NDU88_005834 [Pleurodeles waltl]|uniref:Myb/SANT-like DNA-binding domain-containing protein n=1 Tax=Pleurodeles waltl TaxID=8319 RepID=A0AAV7LNZ5_PLEWA|nr:hypothetical protein NDU88_005834 [Pleurodeles waltl]
MREAIWQHIVDKINSVAEVRRTVTECKKRWHDCKHRTKEKMERNGKAALQTGGGSPAPQEGLDEMEEMVAAVIPEDIVTGIAGQDSADCQETIHMQDKLHGGKKCLNVKCKKGEAPNYYTMHVSPENQAVERAKGHGTGLPALPQVHGLCRGTQGHGTTQHQEPLHGVHRHTKAAGNAEADQEGKEEHKTWLLSQDSWYYQNDDGSPVDLSVLDYPDDMDDKLTTISQETLQDVLGILQTPPPVTRRSTHVADIPEDPPTTPIVRPASSNTVDDSDDTGTTFERTVVGVQMELAKKVRVGMQTMAASLEGMCKCMITSTEQSAAIQLTQSQPQGV